MIGSEPRWAFALRPAPGELLSGFLSRVALAHGATPYGFYALFLESSSFWARDIDRGAVTQHYRLLTAQSGLSTEIFQSLTLHDWMSRLTPTHYVREEPAPITPWINGSGVYHRTRKQHALQFCPACLADKGIVQKAWRLSFVTVCERHGTPLLDACPHCDAPFLPHRSNERRHLCHRCRYPLAEPSLLTTATSRNEAISTSTVEELLRLQRRGLEWLDAQNGTEQGRRSNSAVDSMTVDAKATAVALPAIPATAAKPLSPSTAHWHDLRHLVPVFLTGARAADSRRLLGLPETTHLLQRQRLELARYPERAALMHACERLLQHWPDSFRMLSRTFDLTQRRFAHRQAHSPWLAAEIERLPTGRKHTGGVVQEKFDHKVGDLERDRPENWRALRAAVFMRKVRAS